MDCPQCLLPFFLGYFFIFVVCVFIAIIIALLGVIAFEGFQLFRGPTASESATQQKEDDNQHLDINTLKGDPNDGDDE